MKYTARSYKSRCGGYWGPFHIIGEGNTTLCGWYCGATSSTPFSELPLYIDDVKVQVATKN